MGPRHRGLPCPPWALLLLSLVARARSQAAAAAADPCAAAAVADLDARVAQRGFSPAAAASTRSSWGPEPTTFPPAAAPAGCDATAWARARILGAIDRMVAQGFCYCHHHVPWWMPGPRAKNTCNPDCPGNRPMPTQGVDCSTYSAYLYNLAFGQRFTSAIGKQACGPEAAPGVLLTYTNQQQDMFQPGDILYVTPTGQSAPIRVSHAIVWTGRTVNFDTSGGPFSWDTILANTKPKEQPSVVRYVNARRAAGLPVYIISDSHFTGPNFRAFAGWYANSFSHARRVIGADPSMPSNNPSIASWDGKDCLSNWALNGRGGAGAGAAPPAAGGR